MKFLAGVFLFFAVVYGVNADSLTMKNGDHLTGEVVKADAKQLTLKTDYAGEVNVQWPAIRELTTDKPMYVVTPDKKTVTGVLATENDALVVKPSNAPEVHVPLKDVTTVRSESDEIAYEHAQHPGLLEDWQGAATVGFALSGGNSETTNLSVGFTAVRATPHDKISSYLTSIYSSDNAPSGPGVTANDIRGGAIYTRDFTPRMFGFGSGDFEHNELQDLSLRSILSGGLGAHLIKSDSMTLDFLFGGNYTRENYSGAPNRNLAGITAGEQFLRKFGKSTVLNEQFLIYPDLTNTGNYRFAFDMSTVTKISKWLAWQTSVSDRFLSDPIPGTRTNDIIVSMGLNFAFGKPAVK
jgi:putative salt-induced outer membrane protein